jgi:type IV pilus assembly protein PilC
MVYTYVAYNEQKEIVKGKLEAKNEEQAASLLSYAGYQLINLHEMVSFPTLDRLMMRLNPIKPANIILFYRQMALLIDSGLNVVSALELLESQSDNRVFKRVLGDIIAEVRAGNQLSSALGKHPKIFPPIQCQSLKVGEQTGGVVCVLKQTGDHFVKNYNFKKLIHYAMTYPVIALIVAVVVVGVMVTFVMPSFAGLYSSLGAELPTMMKVMMGAGEFIKSNILYILAIVVAAGIAFYAWLRTARGRYKWDQISLKFPMVGKINHLNELSKLARNIAVLFKAGLPLTEILPLVIQSAGNRVVAEALKHIRDDMLGGEGLSRPMSKYPVFLPMMVQMVRVGEETGNMDSTLLSVASSYEAEAEDRTKAMINMIQPAMTIVIGLVVGIMALSLVSAMYSMYGQSGLG